MNRSLCSVLAKKLSGLTIVGKATGLADTINKDGITFPASCDGDSYEPDSSEPVIIFFKDGNYSSEPMYGDVFLAKHNVIMHVWANTNLIDDCSDDAVIKSIISCVNEEVSGGCIVRSSLSSKSIVEQDAYKGYKFATEMDYISSPYRNWVVTLEYNGIVNENCTTNININNKEC